MEHYDVIVIGLGIMGASVAWRASQMGAQVLALEKNGPTHSMGSSHGATRIFRQAYWEGHSYLGLLSLADQGWRELESISENKLIVPTGGLFIGPKSTGIVNGSLNTAMHGNIVHKHLTAISVRSQFPQFKINDDMEGIYEPGAYAVLAEEARMQMLNEAVRIGARISFGEEAVSIASRPGQTIVKTRSGRRMTASSTIVCGGAANSTLLPELSSVLHPKRVPVFWFKPRVGCEEQFSHKNLPVFLYQEKKGALLYGIAAGISMEAGVKIGFHNRQQINFYSDKISNLSLKPYAQEIENHVAEIFPGLIPSPISGKWCIYTLTPDESFILDESLCNENVFHANVCSGHGFKFAPAIGQVLAELGIGKRSSVDLSAFAFNRFRDRF